MDEEFDDEQQVDSELGEEDAVDFEGDDDEAEEDPKGNAFLRGVKEAEKIGDNKEEEDTT